VILQVAVKVLEKSRIKEKKDVERISREIKILKQLHHPNVVQIYEIIETEQDLYLVMEFVQGGELFDLIVQNQKLKEKQACKYFQELISGINYIHQLGICHRDLKPENLLIDYDQSLKIVDFGLSNLYEQGTTLKTACGSPCYAAPEVSEILQSLLRVFICCIDDCWQELQWSHERLVELWSSLVRHAVRVPAIRRPKDLGLVQEDPECGVHAARLPL
jgi:serine/threonine protein kinase